MRSLFAKVLMWFLAAMTLTILAMVATTVLTVSNAERRRPPFAMLAELELSEARHAYESGGKAALEQTLRRFTDTLDGQAYLFDRNGIDLVTGQTKASVQPPPAPPGFPLLPRSTPMVLMRQSKDKQYTYMYIAPYRAMPLWFLGPGHIWILGLVVLLCYGLAYHLSTPVRELQSVAARLGQGDLSVRSNLKRRDELGRLADSFNDMAARIQVLLTAERRLLQDISHELRSPLARLNVAVELARSGEDQEEALARIEKESNRLSELVTQLLQMNRAEVDPTLLQQQVRLDQLVQELIDDSQLEAKARGCWVTCEKCDPVSMKGHPELLRRAVENVMRNAIRYAPASTSVIIEVEKCDEEATVSVRDFGSGVPDRELQRIFDPFYRVETDRNRQQGGVGLGLAIVKRAIELHHGHIRARNANPGLLVQLSVPLS